MKYYIVCDYRENFPDPNANDHYSYKSIINIKNAIINLGYECEYFGGINKLINCITNKDYDINGIYLNFNDGLLGEFKRGQTPFLLDLMNVKYSGSNPLTHLIISNKIYTNNYLQNKIKNLFIPKTIMIGMESDIDKLNINFPVIIKPNNEGSSIGITDNSICYCINDVKKNYNLIKHFGDIIVQEFVNGYEITNYFIINEKGILIFNELLIIGKGNNIRMDNRVFTSDDKFNHKRKYYNPYEILSDSVINKIKEISASIVRELHIKTFGRIDYRFNNEKIYFIEANTIPAFSMTSDIGEICRIYNMTFTEIISLFLNSLN